MPKILTLNNTNINIEGGVNSLNSKQRKSLMWFMHEATIRHNFEPIQNYFFKAVEARVNFIWLK